MTCAFPVSVRLGNTAGRSGRETIGWNPRRHATAEQHGATRQSGQWCLTTCTLQTVRTVISHTSRAQHCLRSTYALSVQTGRAYCSPPMEGMPLTSRVLCIYPSRQPSQHQALPLQPLALQHQPCQTPGGFPNLAAARHPLLTPLAHPYLATRDKSTQGQSLR